ncbi:uracil-DNA glycosylase-like protein, partial [Fimicolochytrium jonesii]|uniref:uracil-DNA glycosylase-like protein n=1 Tax=Fimicolochytrium jonesii TaxID=1396493 RepID=UPI0022FE0D89
ALKLREASNLLQLERQTMGPDWYQAFLPEMQKPYFQKIKRFLDEEARKGKVVYPAANEIYTFTKCPLNKVKVVIIGQDPYHGPNQAHGLCFSVKKGVTRPPSLQNIFRELESDLGADGFQKPDHGSLEGWCTEGVLLLNATLTVRKKEANSHADIGWQTFTDAIIQQLNKSGDGLVFMLWGAFAQKKGTSIDKKKHLVLMSKHPSPMSANQGGWFGCKHFSKANEWLKERGLTEVNWNHLP